MRAGRDFLAPIASFLWITIELLRRHPSRAAPLAGVVMRSRDMLFLLDAPLHALDGKTVIGDANTVPDLGL